MSHKISIDGDELTVQVNVTLFKDGKNFVAHAPSLDLSGYGDSETEASEVLQEMIDIFMQDIIERNVLSEALEQLGWSRRPARKRVSDRGQWVPPVEPKYLGQTEASVSIPRPEVINAQTHTC